MFVKYLNLGEQPFGATPDPRFLFQSEAHREALASLYCAFYANRGFTALIAEPGMGKTTLLFEFLERMRGCAKTVFLFNTFCGPDDIVTHILRDSGVAPGPSVADRYQQINDMLTAEAKAGRPVVLVVDEAQNLSPHTLEGIRLLTNFETTRSKLIQVVLSGQPQLAEMLSRPELAQLRQRISTISRIRPFSAEDTHSYIQHRLKFAGHAGAELFTPQAFALIAQASAGIPRVINTLCFNALCLCRARRAAQVDDAMVREAIEDLRLPEVQPDVVVSTLTTPPISEPQSMHKRSSARRVALLALASVILLGLCGALFGPRLRHARIGDQLGSIGMKAVSSAAAKVASYSSIPKRAFGLSQSQDDGQASISGSANDDGQLAQKDQGPISVRIAPGDTLAAITAAHLGAFNSTVLHKMQQLNPKLTDPNHIESGETIRLPGPALRTTPTTSTRN